MIDAQIALHVFMAVLVAGTVFRLVAYHAMSSPNVHLRHLGEAMITQY